MPGHVRTTTAPPCRQLPAAGLKEARLEIEAEGYRFDRVIDALPWQHILVFRRE